MSSSYDSGKTRDASGKTMDAPCKKAKDKKHDWNWHHRNSPSWWAECKNCKDTIYGK